MKSDKQSDKLTQNMLWTVQQVESKLLFLTLFWGKTKRIHEDTSLEEDDNDDEEG